MNINQELKKISDARVKSFASAIVKMQPLLKGRMNVPNFRAYMTQTIQVVPDMEDKKVLLSVMDHMSSTIVEPKSQPKVNRTKNRHHGMRPKTPTTEGCDGCTEDGDKQKADAYAASKKAMTKKQAIQKDDSIILRHDILDCVTSEEIRKYMGFDPGDVEGYKHNLEAIIQSTPLQDGEFDKTVFDGNHNCQQIEEELLKYFDQVRDL